MVGGGERYGGKKAGSRNTGYGSGQRGLISRKIGRVEEEGDIKHGVSQHLEASGAAPNPIPPKQTKQQKKKKKSIALFRGTYRWYS